MGIPVAGSVCRTIIGASDAATAGQYNMLAVTALLTLMLVSGTWADRKALG